MKNKLDIKLELEIKLSATFEYFWSAKRDNRIARSNLRAMRMGPRPQEGPDKFVTY